MVKTFQGHNYIQGLHGVPNYHKDSKLNKPEDWYWREGTTKEENYFLPRTIFEVPLSTK